MSYILDALKKAERERRLGKVPGLEIAPGLHTRGHRRGRWAYLIAGALVLNAALLGALYLYWRYQTPPPIEARAEQESRPQKLATTATVPTRESERDEVPESPTTAVEDHGGGAEAPTAGRSAGATIATENPANAVVEPALPNSTPATRTVKTEPQLETEASGGDNRGFILAPPVQIAPLLTDMPESFRQSLRPVTLTVHVFSETPEQRFVFINDRRYQEGQQLVEGPVVETIQPNGVVLSHQGRRFMLTGEW